VHTIASTALLVTMTLSPYARSIRARSHGSPHSLALRSTRNVLAQSRGLSAVTHPFSPSNALALSSVAASCARLRNR
jgi:hypothetical protein